MTIKVLLRLPDELHKELKEKAAQDSRSMHSLILLLLESCLPHYEFSTIGKDYILGTIENVANIELLEKHLPKNITNHEKEE